MVNAVAQCCRHDRDSGGHRQAQAGYQGAPRSPLEISNGHTCRTAHQPVESSSIEEGRREARRPLRPHARSRRQSHRTVDRTAYPRKRRHKANRHRHANRRVVHSKRERRESEKLVIKGNDIRAEPNPADNANDQAGSDDHERKLQIMRSHLESRVAQRFQLGDLLTLNVH